MKNHHNIRNASTRMLAIGLGLMVSIVVSAQTGFTDGKPTVQKEHFNLIAIGHANILDTYLSQEAFQGTELRYISTASRWRKDSKVSSEFQHHILLSTAGTRGNSNTLLTAIYNLRYARYYDMPITWPHFSLKVGGMIDGTMGGSYNTRNSNNPAQARLAVSIDPTAKLAWDFHIRGALFTLNYEASMPLLGLAFSPNFGQSYYEIFSEGNYDHNAVFTSPLSGIQWHHMLTLDFQLWRQTLRIGCYGDIRQMEANSLKYHQYTHGIVVGWKY